MVVVEEGAFGAVGDDEAHRQRVVSQQVAEAVDGRRLHLKVCHPEASHLLYVAGLALFLAGPEHAGVASPFKRRQTLVEVLYGWVQPHRASLRAVEARCRCRDAVVHVVGHKLQQRGAALHIVGACRPSRKLHVGGEGMLHLRQRRVPLFVVVHQSVEADGADRGHTAATVYVLLQRAAGANAHYLQLAVALGLPCPVFHSQRGVELRHDYVDVVAAHACAEGRHAGAVVAARQGVQLAVAALVFHAVEDALEHLDALGVANEQHLVGQGVAGEVYVVEAAVGGQWQFAGFGHKVGVLLFEVGYLRVGADERVGAALLLLSLCVEVLRVGAAERVGAALLLLLLCVEVLRVGAAELLLRVGVVDLTSLLCVEVLRVGAALDDEPLRVGAAELLLLRVGVVFLLLLPCVEVPRVGAVLGAEPLRVGAAEELLLRVGAVVLPLLPCVEVPRVGAADVPLPERVGAEVAVPLCCVAGAPAEWPLLLPVGVGRAPDEEPACAGCSILGRSAPGVQVLAGRGAGVCGARR